MHIVSIHSFHSLYYARFTCSNKVNSPQITITCFLFRNPLGHPVTAYDFFLVFPFFSSLMTCFGRWFLRKIWPTKLAFLCFIVFIMLVYSLTFCNISFFVRSVQLIISFPLQILSSELSRYLWFAFWIVQVSTPFRAMLQIQHLTSFFLKLKSSVLVTVFFVLNAAVAMAFLDLILCVLYIMHRLWSDVIMCITELQRRVMN